MLDDRLVVAAIIGDAGAARELSAAAAAEQRKTAPAGGAGPSEGERVIQALLALAERKPAAAAALLEPVSFLSGQNDGVALWTIAKMQAGDLPSAAKGLAFLVSSDARGGLSAEKAYAVAMLARVQAQLGQTDEARKNYQRFFELFKDADPDLPLLVNAREEFAKLGS